MNAESGERSLLVCVFIHFCCVYSNCMIIRMKTLNDQSGLLKTSKVDILFLM